jgi:hypothetical protein
MVRRHLITWNGEGFKLDMGIRPKSQDYQRESLDNQIRRKHGRLS